MRSLWIVIYIIVALLSIWASDTGNHVVDMLTKPLLIIFPALYLWIKVRPSLFGFGWWILLGLVCSMAGDAFFVFYGRQGFVWGLACFLLTHICYFSGFMRYRATGVGTLREQPLIAVPFLFLWAGMNYFLRQGLHELQLPVAFYTAMITIMTLGAVHLRGKVGVVGNTLLVGVFLFIFSDTFIALSTFKPELNIWHPEIIIVSTYIIAQCLITLGVVRIAKRRATGSMDLA